MTRSASSSSLPALLFMLLLQLLCDGPVQAQNAAKFRQHYEAALREYDGGQYESALQDFQAAYAIKQLPRLLLNIGQIHRKLGHAKDALGYYELYLRVEPNPKPEIKEELQAYIFQTRALLAAAERMKASQDNPTAEAEPSPAEKPAPRIAPPPPTPPPAVVENPQQPSVRELPGPKTSDSPPRPIYKKWWFWTLIGVGVAGAATGIALGVRATAPAETPNIEIRNIF